MVPPAARADVVALRVDNDSNGAIADVRFGTVWVSCRASSGRSLLHLNLHGGEAAAANKPDGAGVVVTVTLPCIL